MRPKEKKSVFIPQPQSYGAEELRGWVGFLFKLRTSCGRIFIRLRVTTPSSGRLRSSTKLICGGLVSLQIVKPVCLNSLLVNIPVL